MMEWKLVSLGACPQSRFRSSAFPRFLTTATKMTWMRKVIVVRRAAERARAIAKRKRGLDTPFGFLRIMNRDARRVRKVRGQACDNGE